MQYTEWSSNDLLDSQTDPCSSHVISREKYQEQDTFLNMPQALALGGLAFELITQSPTDYLYPNDLACTQGLHCSHHLTNLGNQVWVVELNGPSSSCPEALAPRTWASHGKWRPHSRDCRET